METKKTYLLIYMENPPGAEWSALLTKKIQDKLRDGTLLTLYQEDLSHNEIEEQIKALISSHSNVTPVLFYRDDDYGEIGANISDLVSIAALSSLLTGNCATDLAYTVSYKKSIYNITIQ